MSLLNLVKAVPATFWGIVVGSLLTVMGVVLTNASNTKRLRIQHEHERDLDNRERDLSLRRDVYLAAIEAMSAGMVVVGRFGELDIPSQELMRAYTAKSPSVAKVNMVGRTETIEAVTRFSQELTGAFLRLASKRAQIDALRDRTAVVQEDLGRTSRELDQIHERSIELEVGEADEKGESSFLRRSYEATRQRIEELRAEDAALWQELMPMQMGLIQKCVAEAAALHRLLAPAIGLMRAELELPFDQEAYTRVIEASSQKQAEHLQEFIREAMPYLEGEPAEDAL